MRSNPKPSFFRSQAQTLRCSLKACLSRYLHQKTAFSLPIRHGSHTPARTAVQAEMEMVPKVRCIPTECKSLTHNANRTRGYESNCDAEGRSQSDEIRMR